MSYEVKLDIFEGPLDLLLYLIRKNEIDIYNIPMALITEQYLEHLEMMKALNLDLAGEYLVLAATLIHIKSRMLLPVEEGPAGPEEEQDPRAELVRQLLEYQAFKEAALSLDKRRMLDRDVFKRVVSVDEVPDEPEEAMMEVSLFDLIEAFKQVVGRLDKEDLLEIDTERISLSDRINEILEELEREKSLSFTDLLKAGRTRKSIIYTLLAILELMKMRVVRAFQSDPFGPIRIFPAVEESTDG
ncbi:MAG TPA: segregation/condensation protein A [Syntrophales bacterium]|nr:segregation/condensation protein A [Syntrophobacterales bacterium]HQL89031.1 segregation/condensation protein A [Syntrophales bacterium]